jgi:uncharacterized protein YjbI with pentapeptide repeats
MASATVQYANLQSANFFQAKLYGTDFSYSNFTQASFEQASLVAPTLTPRMLRDNPPKPDAVYFTNAIMINTDLSGANADGADLTGALSLTCPAYGTQKATAASSMNSAMFNNAVLVKTVFDNAQLNGAKFDGAIMVDASLVGAYLNEDTSNNATPASFSKADIRGIDASNSQMDGLDMTGATYSTGSGTYTNTSLKDFNGQPIVIAVKYNETILGNITSATKCPNGPPVTDPTTGTLVCELTGAATLSVEPMQGSPRTREKTSS